MKKLVALLCAACLLLSVVPAFAATPKPIVTIPYDQLPATLDGQHHYLLLCLDQYNGTLYKGPIPKGAGNPYGYTDGMVLLTMDTRAHRIMLTSFIRDALVNTPTGTIGRLNNIYRLHGGPEQTMKTISEHIGVKIEKYILFDFNQIAAIIDSLGGVDITITPEEASYLIRYPLTRTQTTPAVTKAGTYRFHGRAAVIYMRIRKVGGHGDFMRTQRVRTVLSTLADTCRAMTYDDARRLLDTIVEHSLATNMTLEEMVEATNIAYGLTDCIIEELRIPPDGAVHPLTHAGMATQELDWEACRAAMEDFLSSSFLVMDDEDD